MVVEYIDRAQGPTLGFLAQNLHTTQSNPAKSTLLRTRPDCGSHSDLPPIFAHSLADASVGQGEVVATILVTDQGHNRGEEAIGALQLVCSEILVPSGPDGRPELCESLGHECRRALATASPFRGTRLGSRDRRAARLPKYISKSQGVTVKIQTFLNTLLDPIFNVDHDSGLENRSYTLPFSRNRDC